MKKFTFTLPLIFTATLFTPLAIADYHSEKLTLAVIDGTEGARGIVQGNYAQVVAQMADQIAAQLTGDGQSAADRYEAAMSLCAANIKLKRLTVALQACEVAVKVIDDVAVATDVKNKYKALALNNRAIGRHLADDSQGAYQDFNQALRLDSSELVTNNLYRFSLQLVNGQLSASTGGTMSLGKAAQ